MKNIILVNGPPRSGKDTVGTLIAKKVPNARCVKFAAAMKRATHAFFHALANNMDLATAFPAYRQEALHSSVNDSYYEDEKSQAMDLFHGLSPRQAYIEVSETFMKKTFDERIFGWILADQIAVSDDEVFVVTDSGFLPEAEVLIEQFGAENIKLIRMSREGCTFEGDSRGYIDPTGIESFVIQNDGPLEFLSHDVGVALDHFSLPRL